MMHREQSPARVAVRVECPGTPRKPHRLETAEFQTPGIRVKELPAVSDVSTACPSSGGFQELDLDLGLPASILALEVSMMQLSA